MKYPKSVWMKVKVLALGLFRFSPRGKGTMRYLNTNRLLSPFKAHQNIYEYHYLECTLSEFLQLFLPLK